MDYIITKDDICRDFDKALRVLDAFSERVRPVDIGQKILGVKDPIYAGKRANDDLITALNIWQWL